jgi:hypothetical protein
VVEGRREPIYVYMSVHDTGPGLKPKDLELLVSKATNICSDIDACVTVPTLPKRHGTWRKSNSCCN